MILMMSKKNHNIFQTNVKYNTEEYDAMMKKAIGLDGKTPIEKRISSESEVDHIIK